MKKYIGYTAIGFISVFALSVIVSMFDPEFGYQIGFLLGYAFGLTIIIGIPAGAIYGIFKLINKKAA